MFGMGMGEIIVILIVALLFIGPDKLPSAAKSIGKGIRQLRRHTQDLQDTIENDETVGGAMRELKSVLRGDDFQPRKIPKPPAGTAARQAAPGAPPPPASASTSAPASPASPQAAPGSGTAPPQAGEAVPPAAPAAGVAAVATPPSEPSPLTPTPDKEPGRADG